MWIKGMLDAARLRWEPLTFYQKFEDAVIHALTFLIAIIVVLALWNLIQGIVSGDLLPSLVGVTDHKAFQVVFGMIFTVIIALEFEKTILVLRERRDSIVQVRTVILIALLAILRKLIIIDLAATDALHLFALATTTLALGVVFWLVQRPGDDSKT